MVGSGERPIVQVIWPGLVSRVAPGLRAGGLHVDLFDLPAHMLTKPNLSETQGRPARPSFSTWCHLVSIYMIHF